MPNKTALLFFSRSAAVESASKRFIHSGKSAVNFKIASSLIEKTRKIAKATALPLIQLTEADQQGETFAEKIVFAIDHVFASGFERVVVIGNDCLKLNTTDILNAVTLLENNELVIGPDNHGGVYLIGIDKSSFNRDLLLELPWQTENLYGELKQAAANNACSFTSLPLLADVNNSADLFSIYKQLPVHTFLFRYIQSCLASIVSKAIEKIKRFDNAFLLSSGLRAPPSIL